MSRSPRLAALLAVALVGSLITLTAEAGPQRERTRVVFVTTPCTQGAFLCPPFTRAVRQTGVSGRIISPDVREDPIATLSLLARQGYDLIIVDLFWADALGKVAPRFPQSRFAIIDIPLSQVQGRPRNARAALIRTNEAAFLAGVLATRMEQRRPGRDVVGAVGGAHFQPVDDFIVGYRAGARYASRQVTVLTDYSGDFADATRCDAAARRQIARGAGVVFNVAGVCGLGALRAAKRAGIWGIGVDTDQSYLGGHILTSVVKHFGVLMLRLLEETKAGRLRTGVSTEFRLRDNGAGLGRISHAVPKAVRDELARLRARIVRGEIRVPGVAPPD